MPTVPSAAAIGRHPHLATPVAAGRVRVDLHSHTMWSGDSTTMPDELATAIVESGIDVLCITDHNAIAGAVELVDRLPCRVVVGEELRTAAGRDHRVVPRRAGAERARSRRGGAATIREQGGLVYVPHPFDPMRRNLAEPALYELAELGLIDAIEVHNSEDVAGESEPPGGRVRRPSSISPPARAATPTSRTRSAPRTWRCADFTTPGEFLAALRAGVVVGHHWDEPRQWSARIVPSV